MYIITEKEENRIINFGKELDYLENGYPRLVEENISFPNEMVNIYELNEIPENIEVEKYCYTEEKGFYKNNKWKPYFSVEERLTALEDMVNSMLMEE